MDTTALTQFLASMNITLSDSQKQALATHIDTTLQQRIINEVVDTMDDDQLREWEAVQEQEDKAQWQWLQENIADLDDIVKDEIDILLGEIAADADQI